jgi:hypothetical protein
VRADVRADDLGMLLVAIAIGVHTLVDLDVPLDLGRAAGSLVGLWRPAGVDPKRAPARPVRRKRRT